MVYALVNFSVFGVLTLLKPQTLYNLLDATLLISSLRKAMTIIGKSYIVYEFL